VPAVDRRAGGVAVWVRPGVPVAAAAHRVLRRYAGLHVRALALAVVAPAGRPLVVGSIHLDLHAGARLAHTAEALDLLRSAADAAGAPRLLAGDVNCAPGSAAWRELTADLVDTGAAAPRGAAATFTARRPRSRIDAVFASSGPAVRGAGVPVDLLDAADVAAASDHRPVLAEIEV
jgi:endonuclease/exonuclease/phosphatase family metal-dependent hydrolase